MATPLNIHIGSDHAGYILKSDLYRRLSSLGHNLTDHGAHSIDSCDYPVLARGLCKSILELGGTGILICGTGIGMSLTANRFKGIRAALCCNEFMARAARQHNDANVLCLGERVVGTGLAFSIVEAFLATKFEGGRHQRRVDLIDTEDYE